MGEPLNPVQPGDPLQIPASTHNAFVEAARDHRARRTGMAGGVLEERQAPSAAIVLVKNASGAAHSRFAVLGIDVPIILPAANEAEFENRVALSCVKPTAGTHEGRFVVLQEPLGAGRIGRAAVGGVTQAWINIDSSVDVLDRVDVVDDMVLYLENQFGGSAKILWREGGTGEQWAIVRLGAVMRAPIVTAADISGYAAKMKEGDFFIWEPPE